MEEIQIIPFLKIYQIYLRINKLKKQQFTGTTKTISVFKNKHFHH